MFLFPNYRMDKYSNWLICWSRSIFILWHLPLSPYKKVQLFLGSPPTDLLKYPCGEHSHDFQEHLKHTTVSFSRSPWEKMTSAFRPFFEVRALSKGRLWCHAFSFIHCDRQTGVLDLTYPEKAVRNGPCRDSWPKWWLLSGEGSPFRTNRKRLLSIMYSIGNKWTVYFSVQSNEFNTLKLVLAQCDPKIKSDGMSLQFRAWRLCLAEYSGSSAEFHLISVILIF